MTVWVALKMRTKPRAIRAYTEPSPIDFMNVWKKSAGSLKSCTTPKITHAASAPTRKPFGAPKRRLIVWSREVTPAISAEPRGVAAPG